MNNRVDLSAFDAAWRVRWPDSRPIGHELRSTAHKTWVRFHSLPESKRYAENNAEHREILTRHLTVLNDLSSSAATPIDDLRVISLAWSGSAEPTQRDSELVSATSHAEYWQSLPYDLSDPDYPYWVHLYVGRTSVGTDELRSLLRLVADDRTSEVIFAPATATWLYHPYDGGGDVIAPDLATRDALKRRYAEWLSPHPLGL